MGHINTQLLIEIIRFMKNNFIENREMLIELDSQMGDGDLGIYMASGMTKAYDNISELVEATPGEILRKAGQTMAIEAPSTMGTLIAAAFITAGKYFEGKTELSNIELAGLYQKFCEGIEHRGGAKLGDKTVLDSLIPAFEAAKTCANAGGSLKEIAKSAYEGAKNGVETAKDLRAVYGRPAYFGDATIGKYDGGTIAGMLICKAISDVL